MMNILIAKWTRSCFQTLELHAIKIECGYHKTYQVKNNIVAHVVSL